MARFRDLTEIMEKAPRLDPPKGFTTRVIARLSESEISGWWRIFRTAAPPLKKGTECNSPRECALYYFIVAFYFFVMWGVIASGTGLLHFLLFFPFLTPVSRFAMLTALWFALIGAGLWRGGDRAIRAVRIGTLAYIISAVMISAAIQAWLHLPLAGILMLMPVVTGILLGLILIKAVLKYERRRMA